jgi:hypothetical protein
MIKTSAVISWMPFPATAEAKNNSIYKGFWHARSPFYWLIRLSSLKSFRCALLSANE